MGLAAYRFPDNIAPAMWRGCGIVVIVSLLSFQFGTVGPILAGPAPADPAVSATVDEVLRTARHPWLRWPDISDVAPALRDLYAGEGDGLFWFEGGVPHPALAGAVDAIIDAPVHGLDPTDYDAERVGAAWSR